MYRLQCEDTGLECTSIEEVRKFFLYLFTFVSFIRSSHFSPYRSRVDGGSEHTPSEVGSSADDSL